MAEPLLHANGTTAPDGSSDERTALDLLTLLVSHKRLLIGLPLLVAASAVAFSLLLPKRYTVESRFVPESSAPNVSRMAGLAAQFGVNLGGADNSESIDFYAELLGSQDLLRSVVLTEFAFPDRGTLPSSFKRSSPHSAAGQVICLRRSGSRGKL